MPPGAANGLSETSMDMEVFAEFLCALAKFNISTVQVNDNLSVGLERE